MSEETYVERLKRLWGIEAYEQLIRFVESGDIELHHIKRMANETRLLRIYNQYNSKPIDQLFDEFLIGLSKETLAEKTEDEAKDILKLLLKNSRVSKLVEKTIERKLGKYV